MLWIAESILPPRRTMLASNNLVLGFGALWPTVEEFWVVVPVGAPLPGAEPREVVLWVVFLPGAVLLEVVPLARHTGSRASCPMLPVTVRPLQTTRPKRKIGKTQNRHICSRYLGGLTLIVALLLGAFSGLYG